MGALPKALKRRGHRVMAVAPRYASYAEGWETGVRIRYHIFGKDEEVGVLLSALMPCRIPAFSPQQCGSICEGTLICRSLLGLNRPMLEPSHAYFVDGDGLHWMLQDLSATMPDDCPTPIKLASAGQMLCTPEIMQFHSDPADWDKSA